MKSFEERHSGVPPAVIERFPFLLHEPNVTAASVVQYTAYRKG